MNNFKEISLTKGEVLFEAGAPADKLYLIQSGASAWPTRAAACSLR